VAVVVIVSSWFVVDGLVTREGEAPIFLGARKGYHCSVCGGSGHSRRTCGRPSKH
jgi:hypothetical protein